MPGAPGSSLACAQCRLSRKRCDMQRPHCARCQRSKILCSGPGNDRTFVHTLVDNGQLRKQRQTLIDNIRKNKALNRSTTALLHDIRRQNSQFYETMSKNEGRSILASTFTLPAAPFATVFMAVLDEFDKSKNVGIFTADRSSLTATGERQSYSPIALSIRALLKLATPARDPFNVSIFALLVLYLGRLKGDDGMVGVSRRAYGTILEKTRESLARLSNARPRLERRWTLIACQIITLRLFELLDHIEPRHANIVAHEGAITTIMKMLGPEAFANDDFKQLLQGLRMFAINNAIIGGHDTIFTDVEWIKLLAIRSSWCPRQNLMDIATRIPNLLSRTHRLSHQFEIGADDHYNHYQEAHMILEQMSKLHTEFETWLRRYETLFIGPLFWNSSNSRPVATTNTTNDDHECRPSNFSINSQLRFHSAPVAGILTAYASFRLRLWMLAADLRQKMVDLGSGETEDHVKSRKLAVRHEADLATKTGWLILEAMPYLSSCFEGSIVLQGALKIAEKYYQNKTQILPS